jgi:hypothetical protein
MHFNELNLCPLKQIITLDSQPCRCIQIAVFCITTSILSSKTLYRRVVLSTGGYEREFKTLVTAYKTTIDIFTVKSTSDFN